MTLVSGVLKIQEFTCSSLQPVQEMAQVCDSCDPEPMNGNDTLFVMYTSGTTGGPKGLEHTQAGYLLYATVTYQVEKVGENYVSVNLCCGSSSLSLFLSY